jgi:hypothetical protein
MRLLRKLTVLAGAVEAARRYARSHPQQVNRVAGKAAQFVDRTTKGRYHKQINTAVKKAHM